MTGRYCSKCKVFKEYSNYHKSKKAKLGIVERCKECVSKTSAKWYASDIEENRKKNRHSHYRNTYNIEPEVYYKMRNEQNNCCAICGQMPKLLRLDHDHITGNIRQLLCMNCNTGLGHFRDSLELLDKAKSYLEHHGKTT